jgi:toxin YoeB
MLDDLEWWLDHDKELGAHVVALIEEVQVFPEQGRGKPKRLGGLAGMWSRRINHHHRLYYALQNGGDVRFYSCRSHDLKQTIWDAIVAGDEV